MDKEETKKFFTNKIKNQENLIFVKLGDGEIYALRLLHDKQFYNQDKTKTINKNKYTEETAKILDKAFKYLINQEDVYTSFWMKNYWGVKEYRDKYLKERNLSPKYFPHHTLLNTTRNKVNQNLFNFYKTIKQDNRKKISVTPEQNSEGTKNFLNVDVSITCPTKNAFSVYEEVKNQVLQEIEEDCILICCCGIMSAGLIYEAYKRLENKTLLDIGSALDPIILNEKTRSNQTDIQFLKRFYKPLIDG